MKNIATVVLLTASLLLVGGGCATRDDAKEGVPSNEVLTVEGDKELGSSKNDAARPLTAATTDETWKTYTNDALGFQFMWPTKGRYAPQWEVTFAKEGSEAIEGGCRVMEGATTEMVSAGGTTFCHSGAQNGDTRNDSYTTKMGSTYATIHFTKAKPATGAANFSWEEHRTSLDGIVGTFSKR